MSSELPSPPRSTPPLDGWGKQIWARHSQPGLLRPHELMAIDSGLSLTANRLSEAVIQRQAVAHYTNEAEPRPVVTGKIIPVTGQETSSPIESPLQSLSTFTKSLTTDEGNQSSPSSAVNDNVNPITASPAESPSLVRREVQRPIRQTPDASQATVNPPPLVQPIRPETPSSIGSRIMRRYEPTIPPAQSQMPLTLPPRLENSANGETMPQPSALTQSIASQSSPTAHQGYDRETSSAPMTVTAIRQNSTYAPPQLMTLSRPFAIQRRAIVTGNPALGPSYSDSGLASASDSFYRTAANAPLPIVLQQTSRMTKEPLSDRTTPLIMRQSIASGSDTANPISRKPMPPDNLMTTRTSGEPSTVIMRQTDPANTRQMQSMPPNQDKGDAKAAASASVSSSYDTDTIVETVMRQLMRRLSIESERRGIKRWF
ncbi:MAG: hypothetical protein GC179_05425 [Anaerolineaceae bacterium]|nr:hypothetical protein [Anaerolineaceae bacterium]